MKPGWQTTEFWGRLIPTLAGLGVAAGVIRPETAAIVQATTDTALPVLQAVIDGVIQLTGLIGAFILQYQHGKERAVLKQTEIKSRGQA